MGTGRRYVLHDERRIKMLKTMTASDWTERAMFLDTEEQMAFMRGVPTDVILTELTRRVITQQKAIDAMTKELDKMKNP